MKIKIILVLLLLNASSIFAQENLFENLNGDFELGNVNFWRFVEVGTDPTLSTATVSSDAYEGNWAAEFTWAVAPQIADLVFDLSPSILPNTQYTYKVAAKSTTGPCRLRIHATFYDANNNILADVADFTWVLTDTYAEHTYVLPVSPANSSWINIGFRVFDENGSRWPAEDMTTLIDAVQLIGPSTDLSPTVMTTTLPTEDVVIASIDVTEAPYNAKNDGSEDATDAFQAALDRAAAASGAVVFVPAGTYRFDGNLVIPETVTLRGEWENPENGNGVNGTILMPYANKGNEEGDPFIIVNIGSGIKDLSIWYPEQTAPSPSAYPWTVHCHENAANGVDNTSVVNVTLVNSYKGIKIGPEPNELHYIRNVYGTPLNQGIWLSQTTDIGRIMNVHFEPKYWSESGLAAAPSEANILAWLQNNPTIGLVMGRSDWEYIYDVSLTGYQTGVQIIKYTDQGPNGVMYGVQIEKSKIGIDFQNTNPYGWAITNSTIRTEGANSACIRAFTTYNSMAQFNNCTFGGDPKYIVKFASTTTGRMSFQNCTFENWGQGADVEAISCTKGSISLMGNTFNLDKTHIKLGANVTNTQILDNTFPTELKIDNSSTGEVVISQEPLELTPQNVPTHPYADVPRPVNNDLFDVMDYGASTRISTDNTAAFQAALDAAETNGGGTVYVPAGMFRINGHITVPTGVELRGIWDVPHHTTSQGSVLLAYEGKGDANGTPFISMEAGSGVRGFTVFYPEQNTQNFYAYPWSIRSLGDNCWIKDVTVSNPYQGVDFASNSSTGHRISYLGAAPLKTGISVANNSGDGWIENVMFNPHYWARSNGYPQAEIPNITTIWEHQQANLEAFKIGSATHEHILGTFVFAALKGMYLAPDDGNSTVDIHLHGTDAGSNAVYLDNNAGSKVNFINTQLVLLGNTQNGVITTGTNFGAEVNFFNANSWGHQDSGPTLNFNGNGTVNLQQFHTRNGSLQLNNGKTRIENMAITTELNPQYIIGAGVDKLEVLGSYASNGFKISNQNTDKSIVELDYYYNKNSKISGLESGWESGDSQNSWDNTLFGNKDFDVNGVSYQCEAISTEDAHSGAKALKVVGNKINNSTPYYKAFDTKMNIVTTTTLSYWIHPLNETGKTGHIDVLFTDGTRLTELSGTANDGLKLEDARGEIGEWIKVAFPIGNYAAGKSIQSILFGAKQNSTEEFDFLMDDLKLGEFLLHVENQSFDQSISFYPNPATEVISVQSDYKLTKVEIYTLLGRKMKEVTANFNAIPLDNLASDLYLLKIYSENGTAVKKFIKN